jgi:hypothetical protein
VDSWLNVQIVGRGRLFPFVAAVGIFATACGIAHPSELNFRTDKRLVFDAPKARSLVRAPLTVGWHIDRFTVAPPGAGPANDNTGYFAVFVDHAPIKPGETMRVVAKNDLRCLHAPGCPDETYLNERRIYPTTQNSLTIPQIPPIAGDTERIQLHTVTLILMSTTGHRIGESAWSLDVRMRKVGV